MCDTHFEKLPRPVVQILLANNAAASLSLVPSMTRQGEKKIFLAPYVDALWF
jgi:hypothetical protein